MLVKQNFGTFFLENVKKNPDKVALIGDGYHITYQRLEKETEQTANLLRNIGIKKGDRIALLFSNSPKFFEIIYGIMRIGAIPVPINTKLKASSVEYILKNSAASLLIYHEQVERLFRSLTIPNNIRFNLKVQSGDKKDIETELNFDNLLSKVSNNFYVENTEENDICYLPYTSGSTGFPKGCLLTHSGQYWNTQKLKEVREVTRQSVLLISTPIYHANAIVNIQSTLLAGGTIVILPRVDYQNIFEAIEKYHITFMTGVSTIYQNLLKYYDEHSGYSTDSLQFVLCGSAEVPDELKYNLATKLNVEVLESYGLTEGGPVVLSASRINGKSQGVLKPLPGVNVKIIRKDGQLANINEVGELWVNSPGVAKGYWNLPNVTSEKFIDGWLKTGDLVKYDGKTFMIIGRKDDLINIAGESTYPKEIENILLKNQEIRSVTVTSIPDKLKGEVPIALVVPRKETRITQRDIQNFYFENGPAYAYPRHIIFLDHLPLFGTGKINRREVEKIIKTFFEAQKQFNKKKSVVQLEINKSNFNRFLGVQVQELEYERILLKLPVKKEFLRGNETNGYSIHGGIIASLIDITGDYAFSIIKKGALPTISLNINYLAPAKNKDLFAEASIVRIGKTISVSDISVFQKNPYKKIAVGRGSYFGNV